MSRAVPLVVFLFAGPAAAAADLPPGALVRLGDDRFRAGDGVYHLALSPDGTRYATARSAEGGTLALTVWDAATGRPVCEQRVSRELFRGFVWGPGGAFAVAARTAPAPKGQRGRIVPGDFCVWDFTAPDTAPPVLPPQGIIARISGSLPDGLPTPAPEYARFLLSADGRRVAAKWESGAGKFAVHVFELKPAATAATLTRAGTIDLGADAADAVRISADGKTVVTFRALADSERQGGAEFVATVWDVERGKPWGQPFRVRSTEQLPRLRGPDSSRNVISHKLVLAPDARSVYVPAEENKVWGFDEAPLVLPQNDTDPKRRRSVIRWPNDPNAEVRWCSDGGGSAFSGDGNVLVIAANRKTYVIDLVGGKELGRLEGHGSTPGAVAVSADGTRIATADRFGLVRLWDARTFRPLHDAPGHRAPVERAELSPDGERLLTWAPDETVRLWDVATGAELRAFSDAPARPTFIPDGTAILFSTKDRLIARDLLTKLEVPLPGGLAKAKPGSAIFAPDGKAVLVQADGDPSIAVYDWPGGKKRFELSGAGPARRAGFSPDGTVVFTDACSGERWDAKTGQKLSPAWPDTHRDDFTPVLALRPHPPLLHVARNEELRVIEAGSGEPAPHSRLTVATDDARSHAVWGIAVSPRGGQFATTHWRYENEVLLCEARTGRVRRTLTGHRGTVRILGFTPDGTKLLTAGGDHTVLVWDTRLNTVPLPDEIKQETSAAKLWNMLAADNARDAYLAMSRLAREPGAAVKVAKQRMHPAASGDHEDDTTNRTDARGIELLDALDTDAARALIRDLAGGHADAFRTQEAKRARERNAR
ncbi:WD40 repeat domain-containing protein [Frigoriglobus tundricola]|uniref:Uncharacterized protein n=1 Tax=Frigoriglobus tundricola TaxID=2774151 RepID=A0A6M5YRK9_9BACT|nr:hypothetical protein [Frigoriglobus tundricola]QJW96060.1 hypothetical protein FTUN_3614 [Frigoriglobus tundricola]